ncbi:hypothetical protein [Thalassomonas actiniarum]|uniref:Uncharacterized protein n=1 Tax=Thalassomonas actiniarum TaxID=485447 RepID=A0AAE9YSS5_9GAMM|nr:hypothetical protein [Thalassomonas actiniarum]WDD98822.1 hypothetical protein SG35_026935 [Thalassomonas actiniarum]
MSNWYKANACSIRLRAKPNFLVIRTINPNNGELEIEYKNYSLVPVTLEVNSIDSADKNVATPSLNGNTPATVDVPRRPNKHVFAKPSHDERKVGDWKPQNKGNTTLDARVDVKNKSNMLIASVSPKDDVSVN